MGKKEKNCSLTYQGTHRATHDFLGQIQYIIRDGFVDQKLCHLIGEIVTVMRQ